MIKNGRAKLVNIRAASGSTSASTSGGTSVANSNDNVAFKSIIEDIILENSLIFCQVIRKVKRKIIN